MLFKMFNMCINESDTSAVSQFAKLALESPFEVCIKGQLPNFRCDKGCPISTHLTEYAHKPALPFAPFPWRSDVTEPCIRAHFTHFHIPSCTAATQKEKKMESAVQYTFKCSYWFTSSTTERHETVKSE
ncbi:hypothetical protein NQD34_013888 [Periophthalmus magnuspinnatus]|nr:hypothetical protein NQD34_013888 [Periophthalmus magnuspinnatus]